MRILEKLTLENLRKNKRRSLVTIVGVMLSSALILAVAGMATSFQAMMVNFTKAKSGDYHDMYQEVPVAQIPLIEQNQHIENYYFSTPLTKQDLGADAWEYYQQYPHDIYNLENYQPFSQLPEQTEKNARYNVFVRYDQAKNATETRDQLLATLMQDTGEDINVRVNDRLMQYEGAMGETELAVLYSMAAIVIGIIVVTSIFAIRNSFSISANERMRQFGMLASIGATPRQIRHSVLFEGLVVGLIGIPMGLVCGVLAVVILVAVVNALLDGMIVAPVVFSVPFWIFPITLTLSFVTILLSCLMPAIRAGRMSPITAIRGNKEVKIKAKKLKTSPLTKKVFGMGGVIASKNLKRSRKKYRTTVISIVVSVATFIGLSGFMGLMKTTLELQYANSDIDLSINGGPVSLYEEVIEKYQIKDYAYYQSVATANPILTLKVNAEYFEKFAKELGIHTKDYNKVAILNDHEMTAVEDGGYKVKRATDLKDGDTYEVQVYDQETASKMSNQPNARGLVSIVDTAPTTSVKIPITKVTDHMPLGFESSYYAVLLISENYDRDLPVYTEANNFVAKNLENTSEIVEYLENLKEQSDQYDNVFPLDVKETMAAERRLFLLIGIFLYGFITVVTLIGVTSVFNTISTNIALRAKEFAMLRSVGMTSKEFNRMVRLESLMYSTKALIIGLPLGVLLAYGFYKALVDAIDFGFKLPWSAIGIAVVAVGVLVSIIMHYSVKQVSKQNIIETIRDDNI